LDERQAARRRRTTPPARAERTSNLLDDRSEPLVGRADRAGHSTRRPGRDPEATARIAESSEDPTNPTRRNRAIARVSKPSPLLEIASASAPNDLPELVADVSTLTVGSELGGRYVILEEPVRSSMALVCKALDRQRERAGDREPCVALKIVASAESADDGMAVHLRQEFIRLSRLHHPNIVAAYDLCTDRGVEFMVLEWLDGQTLEELLGGLNSRRLALRTAREIVIGIASALAHAHAAGTVHGDVKPSNVFITRDHKVKLFDFGAALSDVTGDQEAANQSWATRSYASWELLSGQAPTPAADIYSLGVTAYRLLAGTKPFGEVDALDAKEQGLTPVGLPDHAVSHWPAIRRALAHDAVDRPKDVDEFLDRFLDESYQPLDPPGVWPGFEDVSKIEWGALATIAWALLVWWMVIDVPGQPPSVATQTGDGQEIEQATEFAKGEQVTVPMLTAVDEPGLAETAIEATTLLDETEIDTLVAGIDERILAERLLLPRGDSAMDLVTRAIALAPDNREVRLAEDRIASALLFQAVFSISNGNLDQAAEFIAAAKSLDVEHLALARTEYELAKARSAAIRRASGEPSQ